jgi:hypothetical protein
MELVLCCEKCANRLEHVIEKVSPHKWWVYPKPCFTCGEIKRIEGYKDGIEFSIKLHNGGPNAFNKSTISDG